MCYPPPGFAGVRVSTILPSKQVKSNYMNKFLTGKLDTITDFNENELSLAFRFEFGGREIILGADGTRANWALWNRHVQKRGGAPSANVVNLPHHGSKTDCDDEVMSYIFGASDYRIGISSADGNSHPAPETIRFLHKQKIQPVCTNLIGICGANVTQFSVFPGLDKELVKWLVEVGNGTHIVQVCQGDVAIHVRSDGTISTETETGVPCGFRGGWDFLIKPT